MDKRKNVVGLIIGLVGSVMGLFGVKAINTFLLMSLLADSNYSCFSYACK